MHNDSNEIKFSLINDKDLNNKFRLLLLRKFIEIQRIKSNEFIFLILNLYVRLIIRLLYYIVLNYDYIFQSYNLH